MPDRTNRFQTETAAMRTFALSSPRGDISFKIGIGLVTAFAIAEIFSASYYMVTRRNAPYTAAAPTTAQPTAAPAPVIAKSTPAASVAPFVAPSAAPTVAAAPPSPAISTEERLMTEAAELNKSGDTANALNRLEQATAKNPKNAQAFTEMAKIYESMQNFARSNEMWRKVQEIGPSAGTANYEMAELKLKRGAAVTSVPSPAATPPPAEAAVSRATTDGVPDGSTFGISEVTATETPDTDAETNLMLRIAVKKRANSVIDHTKVKIQVYFYDTVDDKDIKLTDADVNYEWLTPNHDWSQSAPEVLAVTYLRAKNKAMSQDAALSAAASAVNPGKKGRPTTKAPEADAGRRKYLGYIVRIYYNDKLQAVKADPTKLLNLFPPPSTAASP
jgi:hypothetical protein